MSFISAWMDVKTTFFADSVKLSINDHNSVNFLEIGSIVKITLIAL